MPAMFHISFRYSQSELAELDKVVLWECEKGPTLLPHMRPNRTSVLKALVSRELLRLADEQEKIADRLLARRKEASQIRDDAQPGLETPKERKTRLQRERRAKKALVAA